MDDDRIVWLAWRWADTLEILGCYSTEAAAKARCTRKTDGVGPLTLDLDLPEEDSVWPGAYYPLVRYATETR